jgi:chemotaxis protein histidine kinase CheA
VSPDRGAEANAMRITPPATLRKARIGHGPGRLDPGRLARAEAAVAAMADDFARWAEEDIKKLQTSLYRARADIGSQAGEIGRIRDLAMGLKGMAGMFGFTLITGVADSLKIFTERPGAVTRREIDIIAAHVDAIRVVIHRDIRGEAGDTGAAILANLRRLTRPRR